MMKATTSPRPGTMIIFGAAGDLTWRKLVPALYDLYLDQWLSNRFAVLGVDSKEMTDDEFRQRLRQGVDQFSRHGQCPRTTWDEFSAHFAFVTGDFGDPAVYGLLKERLSAQETAWGARTQALFYLATPPNWIETIAQQLAPLQSSDHERTRIVVEKPFGRDLASARSLNALLGRLFTERQIYRMDHYLGKETVQNILAFRFANALFEPIWDRRYIDHMQITVAEQVGVEHRGGYYDHAGALRDIVQNHLLQVLCLVAMEPPVSFEADEIRNKKADVLHAIRPIALEQVEHCAVRGQYGAGKIQGRHVMGYLAEPGVSPDSHTETFAAVKLFVDNWRWQDVPFYLCTGKRLPTKISEVSTQFRPVPHQSFPATAIRDWQPNRLTLHIQPDEGILLRFQAKKPGQDMCLNPVEMRFNYRDAFENSSPEAYETLLLDAMLGDATLFMRADQVEAAWSVITPVLEAWESKPLEDFPNYPSGAWGPKSAGLLFERGGRHWLPPSECGGQDIRGKPSESRRR